MIWSNYAARSTATAHTSVLSPRIFCLPPNFLLPFKKCIIGERRRKKEDDKLVSIFTHHWPLASFLFLARAELRRWEWIMRQKAGEERQFSLQEDTCHLFFPSIYAILLRFCYSCTSIYSAESLRTFRVIALGGFCSSGHHYCYREIHLSRFAAAGCLIWSGAFSFLSLSLSPLIIRPKRDKKRTGPYCTKKPYQ